MTLRWKLAVGLMALAITIAGSLQETGIPDTVSIQSRNEQDSGSVPEQESSEEVIGGAPAAPGAFPWMAALVLSGHSSPQTGLRCGGTLVAPEWVLTAAHCLTNPDGSFMLPSDLRVVVGIEDLATDQGTPAKVAEVLGHERYDEQTGDFDIGLVRLAEPILHIEPVPLPMADRQDLLAPNADAVVAGWGTTSWINNQAGTVPSRLHAATLSLADSQVCQQAFRQRTGQDIHITANMLCAGSLFTSSDACQGDSGGPLLTVDGTTGTSVQVGIVSWGLGCAVPGLFGVYANVMQLSEWFEDHIGTGTAPTRDSDTNRRRTFLPVVPAGDTPGTP